MVFGEVTGGHFNPAVTLGVLIREGFGQGKCPGNILFAFMIITAEIVGGILGVCIVRAGTVTTTEWTATDQIVRYYPKPAILCPTTQNHVPKCDDKSTYKQVFFTEMIGTFIFVSVILNIKYQNGSKKDAVLNAMTVALTLFGMIQMIGHITGGCLNPAIGLVQTEF